MGSNHAEYTRIQSSLKSGQNRLVYDLQDASAVVNLVKKGKLKAFLKGSTLDLAVYEATNAVGKECHVLGRIRPETAYKLVELFSEVFKILNINTVRGFEKEVVNLALREGITVYDASYVYTALKNGLTLVTDDRKLAKTASKYVNVVTTTEISE